MTTRHKLILALHTEALLLTGMQKMKQLHLNSKAANMSPAKSLKCFGITIDDICKHIETTAKKSIERVSHINKLMLNIDGSTHNINKQYCVMPYRILFYAETQYDKKILTKTYATIRCLSRSNSFNICNADYYTHRFRRYHWCYITTLLFLLKPI